jgi:Flp pilus assembly protein CpaB
MAEETQGIQNKGLLIIAVILGLIVVAAYHFHLSYVRNASRGDRLRVLRYMRSLDAGDAISEGDIEAVTIYVPDPKALETVMRERDRGNLVGQVVTESVRRGEYVTWDHTIGDNGLDEEILGEGNRGLPIEIDAQISPGAAIRTGSRVDLTGFFVVGGVARSYWIIKNVRVVSVGAGPVTVGSDGSRSSRGYRTMMIEVSEADALELQNILTHAQGPIVPMVRNRLRDAGDRTVINPALEQFAERASLDGGQVGRGN